ncbi:catecholate siderophore receptor [Methylovorus glucosotrophus]|uniref:TonB-dependent receptor n=1 Tax=Methylovorus glucosotrophus TaxID=266009 RepID=UPI0013315D19|nr:TonB-dependent siderophore receptor [Methylovorus glucosotrophus]KAF0844299.1 catecholate siderophore receptor [Methylovorus glucosotrophus]
MHPHATPCFPVKTLCLMLAALPAIAYAEEATTTLPQVEVTSNKVTEPAKTDGYVTKSSTTATKTNTPLKDVPQAVTVVSQSQIKDQAIRSMEDAIRYTPGVGMAQGEGNRDTVVFRGNASTGDFFLDGVRDDVQYYRDFYNIESVEVLRGANGMIFGRGGAGGVVNRVSKEAGWDPVREISLQAGSYDQRRGSIDIGQAINEAAAFRLNAMVENADSYRDGVSLRRYGINPTVTLFPTEKTKVVLSAEYFTDHRTADRGIPSQNGRPFATNESTFFGNAAKSPTEIEAQNYSALVEHSFDNGVLLRNRTRYSDFDKYYQNVFANSAVDASGNYTVAAYRDDTQRENLFNQTDLLYTLKQGAVTHKLLVGMELGRQDTDNVRYRPNSTGTLTTTQSAQNPVFNGPISFTNLQTRNRSQVDVAAFYLQDQIILNPQWQVIVGARLDKFDVDFKNQISGQKIKSDDDLFSPRAGLIYKPVEPVSLYASYSQSYVPRAGDQLTSLTVVTSTFDPEKFKNTEVGAKWEVKPGLEINAAIFKLERTNVAVSTSATTSALVDGQDTKGFELSALGRITDKWNVIGAYTLQKAELVDTTSVGANGASAPNTPRNTFSLWNRYDINETWGVALGAISRSEMYTSFDNTVQLPGYTRFDGAVYAKLDKNLRLQVNIENILNKEYYLYAHNNNNITPGSPTAARATLIYNF